jgi:hypothetical protein
VGLHNAFVLRAAVDNAQCVQDCYGDVVVLVHELSEGHNPDGGDIWNWNLSMLQYVRRDAPLNLGVFDAHQKEIARLRV